MSQHNDASLPHETQTLLDVDSAGGGRGLWTLTDCVGSCWPSEVAYYFRLPMAFIEAGREAEAGQLDSIRHC